ncbi:MAG: FAD-dependent monooxygenase [Rhodobacter sp.]|uniref:FAD-dependent monooxygenase n=1 Tax=Pararhodobacter sp. TaxID=2127056 RepID=UPI002C1C4C6D|nr:FAD-dependent monooxygenase [Pararhodobacter sp.]MCC0073945.1 FAD-dependent monooxygenase [Rhodobacter sp.]HPD91345.1 FAD-dependent monooxygenase [Pararhodobacter sp.]
MLNALICGGGVGGMATAIALGRMGHKVTVFEQARQFGRVGADVNLTPNAVHALDRLGVGESLRANAARPTHRISKTWDTGAETSRLPMSAAAEDRYGAPQLTIHRADLLAALEAALPAGVLRFGAPVAEVGQTETGAWVRLADGTTHEGDVVIGADGIHSRVRAALFGPDDPKFTGLVSWRGVFDRAKGAGIPDLDAFTKWWGPTADRQIVTFPLTHGKEIFIFATHKQDDWAEEGWTLPGDVAELRGHYADFHPHARALLDACDSVTRSALHVREPMAAWSRGRITILGDAAHPMVPFMAQGACMAIEDAVVLARALETADSAGVAAALARYEAARIPRTAEVQRSSLANEWLKSQGNADWVYGYQAWTTPV